MHPEEKLKSHITVDVHWRAMCKLWICLDCPQHCPTLKLQEIEDLHRWRNTDRAFMEADIHQARAGHFSVRSCRSHRTCGEERAQVEMVLFILFCLAFSFGRASKKRRMARHTYAEASAIRIVFTCLTVLVATVTSMSQGRMSASVYLFQHCVKVTPKPDVPVANRKSDIVYDVPVAFVSES